MPPKAPDTLPANFTGWDKEPPDTLPKGFDGFDEDRPSVPRPIPDELKTPEQLGFQKVPGLSLDDVAHQGPAMLGFMSGGGLFNAGKEALPVVRPVVGKVFKAASEALDPDLTGMISPRAASAQRWMGKAAKALLKTTPEAAPDASALGKIPLRDFGEAAPTEAAPTAPKDFNATAPMSKAEAARKLEQQLGDAMGAKPLQRDVPIGKQFNLETPQVEAGHTPIKSSALDSFKYDEAANEFHAKGKDGITYIYGDVSPEQAQYFQDAPSKGKAWQAIRNGSPLVGKVVNGTRIAVKAAR